MKHLIRIAGGLALTFGFGALTGCGGLITNQQEVEIGQGVDQALEEQYKLLEDSDPVALWARQLVKGLVPSSKPFRNPDDIGGYKVEVIADNELVNAFAAPGGFTYLSTGFILQAGSCAEVAGVMGHELGHVTQKHGVKSIEAAYTVDMIAGFFLEDGLTKDAANGIFGLLQGTKFSREDEAESDSVGLQIAFESGYNPYGLVDFFERLAGQGGGMPEFLSSHPSSDRRMKDIGNEIKSRYGDKVVRNSKPDYKCRGTKLTFEQVKARIKKGQLKVRAGTGTGTGAEQ
ncbi:MAG: M48 family metalloprotease [Bradymonadia bacterium]